MELPQEVLLMLDRREFLRLGLLSSVSLLAGCHQFGGSSSHASATPRQNSLQTPDLEGHEFIVRNRRPRDLETPVEVFDSYLTPNNRFFVRSHHPEPKISDSDWELLVDSDITDPLALSLADLKQFQAASVTAVLQCAGNSRGLYRPAVPGVQWGRGAVGNAEWRGARLRDVLTQAGFTEASPQNVVVRGADKPLMKTVPVFERNIPLSKCLHPDTLLAYEMNGEPLPPLHGGPVRLVVPGWVGDDWIKWITHIHLQREPSQGFYYQKAYRYPTVPMQPGEVVAAENMAPMEELVTRSLFARPSQGEKVSRSQPVKLQGVAWTGGEKTIVMVEISADEGKSWLPADFKTEEKPYSWRLWECSWKPTGVGPCSLRCRATDSDGFVQPLEDSPWNPGGYLWKAADHLELVVEA